MEPFDHPAIKGQPSEVVKGTFLGFVGFVMGPPHLKRARRMEA
jgi:hypothetical protein